MKTESLNNDGRKYTSEQQPTTDNTQNHERHRKSVAVNLTLNHPPTHYLLIYSYYPPPLLER